VGDASEAKGKEDESEDVSHSAKFMSGRGDWVGEAAFLNSDKAGHSHSAICFRDTEYLAISHGAFSLITSKFPNIHLRISKLLARRLHAALDQKEHDGQKISTIALVPITKAASANLTTHAESIGSALSTLRLGRVLYLNGERLDQLLGRNSAKNLQNFNVRSRVSAWLAQMEQNHRFLILSADPKDTQWTRLCVRSADHIFLVAESKDSSKISKLERSLFLGDHNCKSLAEAELVLVHPATCALPKGTANWLRPRRRLKLKLAGVHHVRKGSRVHERRFWNRIARVMANLSVGLVLGGGGSRGLAHQGVLNACREKNIPIDFIAGTSQGSFMSALYAIYLNADAMKPTVENFSRRMGSIFQLLQDATLPIMSYFSGKKFNETILQAISPEIQIEDLWIPFFCVTTNVSKHQYQIHRQGTLWKAVRASMSLMEYLPPMLIDGDLLVDGGYLNNLPGDIMRDVFRPAFVIGVDVEGAFSEDLVNVTEYGDDLSGFWICYRKILGMVSPVTPRLRLPKFTEMVSAVEYINNTRNIQNLRESGDLDLYIKPMLANTGLLDYHKLAQIEKIGYEAAQQQLNDNRNRIPKAFLLPSWETEEALLKSIQETNTPKRLLSGSMSRPSKYSNHSMLRSPLGNSVSPSEKRSSTPSSLPRSHSQTGLQEQDDLFDGSKSERWLRCPATTMHSRKIQLNDSSVAA